MKIEWRTGESQFNCFFSRCSFWHFSIRMLLHLITKITNSFHLANFIWVVFWRISFAITGSKRPLSSKPFKSTLDKLRKSNRIERKSYWKYSFFLKIVKNTFLISPLLLNKGYCHFSNIWINNHLHFWHPKKMIRLIWRPVRLTQPIFRAFIMKSPNR